MKVIGYISGYLLLICLQACSSSPEGKNLYQEPRFYEETFYLERKGVYRLGIYLVEERARKPVLKSAAILDNQVQKDSRGNLHYTLTGLTRKALVEACRRADRNRDRMVRYREAWHAHNLLVRTFSPDRLH
jgi:hypothetical protein